MHGPPPFPIYRAAFSGLLAMLVGIGIARFGYSPLVPALVAAHWYSATAAFWLGAVNLLGYFIGAWVMRGYAGTFQAKPVVLALMGITAAAILGSAANFGVLWFGVMRLASGVTGGLLMVLMAAAVVGRAAPADKGKVSGITFAGMGSGITLSSLVIPVLISHGLVLTWLVLGGLCLAAMGVVAAIMPGSVITLTPPSKAAGGVSRAVAILIVAYAMSALGFVPHMLFWSSFVAIGLHRGVAAGADVMAWLGIAAALGPVVLGRVADRFGFLRTIIFGYLVMGSAVALPLFNDAHLTLVISSIGVGSIGLGSVMLVAGAIAGLVPAQRLAPDWGLATMAYAVMQALVAAGFSTLFHITGSFLLLYGIGAGFVLVSSLLVMAAARVKQ